MNIQWHLLFELLKNNPDIQEKEIFAELEKLRAAPAPSSSPGKKANSGKSNYLETWSLLQKKLGNAGMHKWINHLEKMESGKGGTKKPRAMAGQQINGMIASPSNKNNAISSNKKSGIASDEKKQAEQPSIEKNLSPISAAQKDSGTHVETTHIETSAEENSEKENYNTHSTITENSEIQEELAKIEETDTSQTENAPLAEVHVPSPAEHMAQALQTFIAMLPNPNEAIWKQITQQFNNIAAQQHAQIIHTMVMAIRKLSPAEKKIFFQHLNVLPPSILNSAIIAALLTQLLVENVGDMSAQDEPSEPEE